MAGLGIWVIGATAEAFLIQYNVLLCWWLTIKWARPGDRVAEVEEMLKTFETENILNLEGLFLNSDRLRKVMEIVQFSSKPGTSVVFTRCEIDENSLQMARTTASKAKAVKMNGIRACEDPMEALFEGEDLLELQKLDISSLELKATESFENLLRRAPKLRHLVMAAARISPTFNPSRAVSAISKMQNLVELDLSYCTWIKGDDWGSAFGSLDTLAKLRIISVDLKNVEFEITWLPSLTDLNVCGSKLEWSSFMEWVGTSSLTRLDVSSTDITVEQLAEVGEHRGGRLPLAVIARRLRSVDEDRLHSLLKPLAEAKVDLVL
ncbi:unnamed protein product [Caenorhabditis auriculariae]|uniref:Uncharacterized protein n=1 Tax=Caenorhabditis auriculariae TaxID=2777116 RepID=A0A8S1GRZ9_9PELO|nr:unnamed protein product [Caenorhabditis auriculariae]